MEVQVRVAAGKPVLILDLNLSQSLNPTLLMASLSWTQPMLGLAQEWKHLEQLEGPVVLRVG